MTSEQSAYEKGWAVCVFCGCRRRHASLLLSDPKSPRCVDMIWCLAEQQRQANVRGTP